MLKKRVIFTLLYENGYFSLSRNFRLQKIGDLDWLQKNYNFSKIAFSIDELIILDVSRKERNFNGFLDTIKQLTTGCFIPIAAGGGISSIQDAKELLRSGADKIVVNSALFNDYQLIRQLAIEFGQQCVVASVDVKSRNSIYQIWTNNGMTPVQDSLINWLDITYQGFIGELYLNSIERDGTGNGYDLDLLDYVSQKNISIPLIIAGGVGKSAHLAEGLSYSIVDAVATSNLLNFVGDGLYKARQELLNAKFDLPIWTETQINQC